jgi:hypothetical protein
MRKRQIACLRWALVLGAVAAWSGAASAQVDNAKLLASATEIWQAVRDCDLPPLERAILTRSEFASYPNRTPPDGPEYQKLVDSWLEEMVKPFCDAPKAGFRLRTGQPKIADVVSLPAGGKRKRPMVIALITVQVFVESGSRRDTEGKASQPLLLLQHEGRWRILVKK